MAKGIKRKIRVAINNVSGEISNFSKRGGIFAGGLASEGYNGGYRDALFDILSDISCVIHTSLLSCFTNNLNAPVIKTLKRSNFC